MLWCAAMVATALWTGKIDLVLFKEPGKYAAFPRVYTREGRQVWVRFGWNTVRSHYGRHAGGRTGTVVLYSPDGARTWLQEGQPGFRPLPLELTVLKLGDGGWLRVGAVGWEALKPQQAEQFRRQGRLVRKLRSGAVVACWRAVVQRSEDQGRTWHRRFFDPGLTFLMGGPARAQLLSDGTIVCPLYGAKGPKQTDRSLCFRSTDGGRTWQMITAAYDGVHTFNEWCVLEVSPGRLIGLIRTQGGRNDRTPAWKRGFLYEVVSEDGGKTWSRPRWTPLWGYPADLIKLRDGRILATYGYRRPPYGIRACFSYDGGRRWDWRKEVILRADALPGGPSKLAGPGDLGYPQTIQLADGRLLTVYYITLGDGITHIAASVWTPDWRGPRELPRGKEAIRLSAGRGRK